MIKLFAFLCACAGVVVPVIGAMFLVSWLNAIKPTPWWVPPTTATIVLVAAAIFFASCAYFMTRTDD